MASLSNGHFFGSVFGTIDYFIEQIGRPATVVQLRDIYKSFKLNQIARVDQTNFYTYTWDDSDRLDTIAHHYYGSGAYWWVVALSANIIDPYTDLPLPADVFERHIQAKYENAISALGTPYGDLATAYFESIGRYGLQHPVSEYMKTVNYEYRLGDGTIVDKKEYDASGSDTRRQDISVYLFELEKNEAKRHITLLKKENLPQLLSETKRVLLREKRGR